MRKRPEYFERNLRWILGSELHPDKGLLFVPSETIRQHVVGGVVAEKFNNIRPSIFQDSPFLDEQELVDELSTWLGLVK